MVITKVEIEGIGANELNKIRIEKNITGEYRFEVINTGKGVHL